MFVIVGVVVFTYADYVLTGSDGQTHQTGAVDGHDAVTDTELPAALCRTAMKEVGNNHRGQDGTPARLHNGQTQDITWSLGDGNLHRRHWN